MCVAGGSIGNSCNNTSPQTQQNSGSNAAAQQGGSGKGGGNSINQGIGQSQSSNQNAMCVAGGSIGNSCNNTSTQTQQNSGSNAAAQQGGSGKGGGYYINQGKIQQSQSSNQDSLCVSGADAYVGSCNNTSLKPNKTVEVTPQLNKVAAAKVAAVATLRSRHRTIPILRSKELSSRRK